MQPLQATIVTVEEMRLIDPNYVPRESIPVRPSLDQINMLLEALPKPHAAIQEAALLVELQLRYILLRRMMESDFVLENSESAMDAYIQRQDRLLESARNKDGTMLGQIGASAESCANTQTSLKTKKAVTNSMSIRLQGALSHITSLLHAQESPKDSNMSVHFLYKVTKRQVIDLAKVFVGVSLPDLLEKDNVSIGKLSTEYELPEFHDDLPFNVCYNVYKGSDPNRHYDYDSYYLRLVFNKNKLYAFQLTPYKIAAIIRANESLSKFFRIIPSGLNDAFIDIYPTSGKTTIEGQKSDLYYDIYGMLKTVIVQGIPEIEALAPESIPYHTFFKSIRKLWLWDVVGSNNVDEAYLKRDDVRLLEYDLMTMANHNYPSSEMIEDSLSKAGVTILERLYKPYTERLYAYIIEADILLSAQGLNKRLEKLKKGDLLFSDQTNVISFNTQSALYEEAKFEKLKDKFAKNGLLVIDSIYEDGILTGYVIEDVNIELSEALESLEPIDSEYVYAVLKGCNMSQVMQYPWVDSSRVTTNSIPKMSRHFGIEVARNYFIYDYIDNKNAVDAISQPRYTFIIADDMTYWGEPFGIDFHNNAKKKDNNFVTLATNSRPSAVFARAASRGETAPIITTAASILATGEIFAGTTAPVVLHPTKENILAKIALIKPSVVLRNVGQNVSERLGRPNLTGTPLFDKNAIDSIVIPTLLPEKAVVLKIGGELSAQRPYHAPFVMPTIVREILEDTIIPSVSIETPERISGIIVTKSNCLALLSRRYQQRTYNALAVLIPASSQVFAPIYPDYRKQQEEKEEEYEEQDLGADYTEQEELFSSKLLPTNIVM